MSADAENSHQAKRPPGRFRVDAAAAAQRGRRLLRFIFLAAADGATGASESSRRANAPLALVCRARR